MRERKAGKRASRSGARKAAIGSAEYVAPAAVERCGQLWRELQAAHAELAALKAGPACAAGVLDEPIGREFQIRGTIQEAKPYTVTWQQLIGCRSMGAGSVTRDTLESAILAILEQLCGTFSDLVKRAKP